MVDMAKECHVTYRWLVNCRKRLARVKDPLMTAVTKEQSSTSMERWKDLFFFSVEYRREA